ncbi:MAG: MFS transporter [Bacillota bacterium]|nr:MFS transporter [Bacillota bacterium]
MKARATVPVVAPIQKATKARYLILFLVCMMTGINYMGRTNLAVAAPYIQQELGLSPAMMGIVFSSFAWTYTVMQIPSGWILDRFGSRTVYGATMFLWSSFIGLMGCAANFTTLIIYRLALGLCGAPTFPANGRIVTAWFPARERGLAIGGYIGAQYIGLAFLTPLVTWIIVTFGWPYVFFITGFLGIGLSFIWYFIYRVPQHCHYINLLELKHIEADGEHDELSQPDWKNIKQLLKHRQLWGMFIGGYAVSSISYFFITWFPSYLVNAKGLTLIGAGFYASAPFLAAIIGVMTGGRWSDWMLYRGHSFGTARKVPIITGLLLASSVAAANYTNDLWMVTLIMSFAFFGQNMANTGGWALLSDLAPRELVGITGGFYNFSSNMGGVIAPLVVGFIVDTTNSYQLALFFISATALLGLFSYVFIVGKPYRITTVNMQCNIEG